jgi:hypothetical protein
MLQENLGISVIISVYNVEKYLHSKNRIRSKFRTRKYIENFQKQIIPFVKKIYRCSRA